MKCTLCIYSVLKKANSLVGMCAKFPFHSFANFSCFFFIVPFFYHALILHECPNVLVLTA